MNVINRYVNAWNQHNADEIKSCFSDSGIYIDANLNEEISPSLFALRASELFTCFPNLKVTVDQRSQGDEGIISLQWCLSGTIADKKLYGTDVFCVRNNKIQSLQVYFSYETGLIFSKVPSLHLKYTPDHPTLSANPTGTTDALNVNGKYLTSGLTGTMASTLKVKLTRLMEVDKLFLDEGLTLANLAGKLDTTTNHLSQLINSQYLKNFYDFINYYRIDHIKQKLTQDKTIPILDLYLEAGFKSSSTFYTAFKKETGQTPSQYQKSIVKKDTKTPAL